MHKNDQVGAEQSLQGQRGGANSPLQGDPDAPKRPANATWFKKVIDMSYFF